MSDASGPQRIEVLESNVGKMKVELSRTRAKIEQMMGMMQKLLQAKSGDGGQHEEKPGSIGRGGANDDSGGIGRASHETGLLVQGLALRQQLLQGEYNHNSRASEGSRPVDGTSQILEVLVGVGPMINVRRGETRDSFLAGIVAHDGCGVSSSGFQSQSRVVPPVLKGEKYSISSYTSSY